MAVLLNEHQQWLDNGVPIVNGLVFIGTNGNDPTVGYPDAPTNLITIYSDRDLTTPIDNPQPTGADGRTVNKVWIEDASYSVVVRDSEGVQKYISLDKGQVSEIRAFDSWADMKTKKGDFDGQQGFIHSYYGDGAGGGGPVAWNSTSTEADDGGMVGQVTGVTTGRWKRPEGDYIHYRHFGAKVDGITNDDAAFVAACAYLSANGGALLVPYGKSILTSSGAVTLTSNPITILGMSKYGSILEFSDSAYTAIELSTSGGGFNLHHITIKGNNATTPAITLLNIHDGASNFDIHHCALNRAATLISLNNTYIGKIHDNEVSVCDRALLLRNTEGSTADIGFYSNTIGTCTIGTNPVIETSATGLRVNDNYIETQNHTKLLLLAATGSQRVLFNNNTIEESGGIKAETSVTLEVDGGTMFDVYDSINSRTIRVDGGANGVINGVTASYTTAGVNDFLNSSSSNVVSGCFINKALKGISMTGGVVEGNLIANCTTGINSTSSEVVIGKNSYSGNTTDVLATDTTLTISAGVIAVAGGDSYIVDTEASAATDDIDTINGGYHNLVIAFRALDSARSVVFKNGTGNMLIGADVTLDNNSDQLILRYDQGKDQWLKASFADNGV